MRTPVFLSSLHMNCTVHSFMLTNVMKEKQKGGRIKKKTGPIKLYTCVMLGEKKKPSKNVQCCSKHIRTSHENKI